MRTGKCSLPSDLLPNSLTGFSGAVIRLEVEPTLTPGDTAAEVAHGAAGVIPATAPVIAAAPGPPAGRVLVIAISFPVLVVPFVVRVEAKSVRTTDGIPGCRLLRPTF